jgi:hypothetical protein
VAWLLELKAMVFEPMVAMVVIMRMEAQQGFRVTDAAVVDEA